MFLHGQTLYQVKKMTRTSFCSTATLKKNILFFTQFLKEQKELNNRILFQFYNILQCNLYFRIYIYILTVWNTKIKFKWHNYTIELLHNFIVTKFDISFDIEHLRENSYFKVNSKFEVELPIFTTYTVLKLFHGHVFTVLNCWSND